MDKEFEIEKVIEKVHDGSSIMFGGFLGVGAPLKCIEGIVAKGVKNLTVISTVGSNPGGGFDLAPLFANKQVKKFITTHIGTCPETVKLYKTGELEVEFYPMGTWIEKVRAGGAGLGGVITPIGIGTLVEQGKQKITIDGKKYLVELPLRAEFAFIKGFRADKIGNVEYRGAAMNSNPVVATAADFTVAEVEEIVPVGGIEPLRVGTPGIFVKALVRGASSVEHQQTFEELWVRSGLLKA